MRERLRNIAACAASVIPASMLLILAALFAAPAGAAGSLATLPPGAPPVSRFVPDLEVYPQNFDITLGFNDEIVVGSHDGVLRYDGERWTLLPLPNNDIVRSLSAVVAHDGERRIYVGGYDTFGYLLPTDSGGMVFEELLSAFAKDLPQNGFADIWDVFVHGDTVFFKAVNHLFAWNAETGASRSWYHEGRFGAIGALDGEVILQFRGEGLRRLREGEWQPMPGTAGMQRLVFDWIALQDGSLLSLQRDGRWRRVTTDQVEEVAMPAGLPPSSYFNSGVLLDDGTLALITPNGELFILDLEQQAWNRFVIDNTFLSGMVRTRNGLLISGMDSVMHVAWPAHWMVVDGDMGLSGSLNGLAEWRDHYFVLTSAGVSRLDVDAETSDVIVVDLDWADGHAAWDLLPLDDNRALLGNSYELLLIDAQGRKLASLDRNNLYPRLLQRSRFDSQLIYIGTELGLAAARAEGGTARLLWRHDFPSSPGVTSLVETAPGELLLGTERGGALAVRVSGDGSEFQGFQALGEMQGLAYGAPPSAAVTRDAEQVIVSTKEGVFLRRDKGQFEQSRYDGLEALRLPGEQLQIGRAPDGEYWAFDYRHIYHRYPDEPEWHEESLNVPVRSGFSQLEFTPGGDVVFVAGSKILFHSVSGLQDSAPPQVRFTSIEQILPDATRRPLSLDPGIVHQLSSEAATLHFDYALPEFEATGPVQYQARMVGLENSFSDWTASNTFTYYRIQPGEYTLLLRSRDSAGRVSEAEPFRFVVLPHWYESNLAIGVWILLGVLAVAWLVRIWTQQRLARLREETLRLEEQVAIRTRELESANRQLSEMAHLDGLTEIPNRRRLDEYLDEVWRQCRESNRSLSVLVIDVDHFKAFNDRFGHVQGDALLKRLARMLSQSLRRAEDLVARYGGEEFLVILPGAREDAAVQLAEAMREKVESTSLGATISVGVATTLPNGSVESTDLVSRADKALYRAKSDGRNCVRVAGAG